MKKATGLLLPLILVFLLSSCLKENHSVRFKNDYYITVNDVVIGNANIGSVSPNSTSSYKSVKTGNFSISATTSGGQVLSGGGSISGRGTHKWTVTLSSAGTISMTEDKK